MSTIKQIIFLKDKSGHFKLRSDIKILKGKKLLDYIKKYDKKHIQKLG